MFDSRLRPLIDPPLNSIASAVERTQITANAMSIFGLALAGLAFASIAMGWFAMAVMLIVANRLADGLDGAVARRRGSTELGGYYDIVFDFLFYGAVPLGFALYDPAANALPAAVLLAAFYANGATFLGFSAIAAKLGLSTEVQGKKTIYYFAGIAEGAETIAVFIAFCLLPDWVFAIAYAFAALCFASAATRIIAVRDALKDR